MYAERMAAAGRPPLPASPEAADLAACRSALDARSWSMRELVRLLPAILRNSGSLAPEERTGWIAGLHEAWRRHGWALSAAARGRLLELAAGWCDWPLVLAIGETLGDTAQPHDALQVIEAYLRLGEDGPALDLALHWQLASPHDGRFAAIWEDACRHRDFRRSWPVFDGGDWGEPDLRLEPLAHHHLDDFAWQYFDPGIAERCCLPDFADGDVWHGWLDGLYAPGDELPLAVLHREYGFVGCSHLVLRNGIGFLYYWLGADYRGQGLAFRANRLLLEAARDRHGMRACSAKAFRNNAESRRLLARLGFAELALPPETDGEEAFYGWGEPFDAGDLEIVAGWMKKAERQVDAARQGSR